MKVPAISGAEKDVFDTAFWKGITRRDGDRPLEGSIGVYWHLYKDLRDVIDFEKEYVNPLSPRKPREGAPIKTAVLTLLRAFFNFAQQTAQPYFFIKKGTRPLWLVRKTGTYWYEDREGWNPHRISFEFVRDVTEEEGRAHTGIGIKTLFQMELNEPKLGAAPLEEEEMPPKKVTTTVATATKTTVTATATAKPKKTTKAESTAATVAPGPVPGAIKAYAASHVETNDVPLLVEEVEIVRIVPLEYKGVSYIRDPIKNKVYKRTGAYVGRWSPKDETIHTEIPNSDDE